MASLHHYHDNNSNSSSQSNPPTRHVHRRPSVNLSTLPYPFVAGDTATSGYRAASDLPLRSSDRDEYLRSNDLTTILNTSLEDSATMGRPSLRRGPSDLGRTSNGMANFSNGSAIRSQHDIQSESARDTPMRQILSGALYPLPWLFASFAYQNRMTSRLDADDRPLGEEDIVSGSLVDSCLYAFTLASLSFLAITAGHRIQQHRGLRKGKAPSRARQPQNGGLSLTSISEVSTRLAGLVLPFIAATQLGGVSVALILILSQMIHFSGAHPGQRVKESIRKSRDNQYKLGAMLILLFVGIVTGTTKATGIVGGVLSMTVSVLIYPVPLLSGAKSTKSRFELQQSPQSNPLASLIAAGRHRIYIPWAGYVSAAIATVLYFLSPSETPFRGLATPVLLASFLSATAVLSLAFSSHFSLQSHLALLTSGAVLALFSFFVSTSYPSKLLQLGLLVLAYGAVKFDNGHSTHDAHKDHKHEKTHSKFTGYVLTCTTPGSVIHTIISKQDSRRIAYFGVLNLMFMVVQFFYGYATGSLGLLTDSIHMLFDCIGLGVGLAAAVMSKWPPSVNFPYGYAKLDTLGGFANAIFLVLVSIEIVFDAVHRIKDGQELSRLNELLVVSTLGLLVNIVGLTAFGHAHHHHGHDHGHSHSHDHAHTHTNGHAHGHSHNHDHDHKHTDHHEEQPVAKQAGHHHHDDNMQGIFLHIAADALGSVAVIISTLLIKYNSWNGWDPLASCLIAILIFFSALPLARSTGSRLLLSLDDEAEYKCRGILQGLTDLPDVLNYSGVRLWLRDQESEDETHEHKHENGYSHSHNHEHKHDHKHDHTHAHDTSQSYQDHTYNDHGHDHSSCASPILTQSKGSILGVIHIITTKNADIDRVRIRTEDYLRKNDMDVVVHVEQDGSSCFCGGGARASPR